MEASKIKTVILLLGREVQGGRGSKSQDPGIYYTTLGLCSKSWDLTPPPLDFTPIMGLYSTSLGLNSIALKNCHPPPSLRACHQDKK
jgi:hypothetical protein